MNVIEGDMYLNQEVALVTGGGTGIGLAIAKELLRAGSRVCITGRREDVLKEAISSIDEECLERITWFTGDVTLAPDREKMLLHTKRTFSHHVTVLVNNAGQNVKQAAVDVSDDDFSAIINTHVNAAFALSRDVAGDMMTHGKGSIIFLASMASFMGVPNVIAYTTAKSAVLGLTRGLAAEWSSQGVRVNAIAPGWIQSAMTEKAFKNDEVRKQKVLTRTPIGQMGEPQDIAHMAAFLCSSKSKFITGQCYNVDGGAAIGF